MRPRGWEGVWGGRLGRQGCLWSILPAEAEPGGPCAEGTVGRMGGAHKRNQASPTTLDSRGHMQRHLCGLCSGVVVHASRGPPGPVVRSPHVSVPQAECRVAVPEGHLAPPCLCRYLFTLVWGGGVTSCGSGFGGQDLCRGPESVLFGRPLCDGPRAGRTVEQPHPDAGVSAFPPVDSSVPRTLVEPQRSGCSQGTLDTYGCQDVCRAPSGASQAAAGGHGSPGSGPGQEQPCRGGWPSGCYSNQLVFFFPSSSLGDEMWEAIFSDP